MLNVTLGHTGARPCSGHGPHSQETAADRTPRCRRSAAWTRSPVSQARAASFASVSMTWPMMFVGVEAPAVRPMESAMLGAWGTRNRAYERDEKHKARCRRRAAGEITFPLVSKGERLRAIGAARHASCEYSLAIKCPRKPEGAEDWVVKTRR